MAFKLYNKEYTYVDVRDGTVYPAHTCTDQDEESKPTGADLRFAIADGGDCTVSDCNRFSKKTMNVKALGTGR